MPKIIKNLEVRLMEEARKQIRESGYGATTIRSVAQGCGVGVGTVYNYFSSKEELLASYMLLDWEDRMAVITAVSADARSPECVVRSIFDQVRGFTAEHMAIIGDEAAAAVFHASFRRYHAMLRTQLAAPLRKFCAHEFAAEFIAESLLTWIMAGKSFDELFGMVNKLF